jgi:hypothetical protein
VSIYADVERMHSMHQLLVFITAHTAQRFENGVDLVRFGSRLTFSMVQPDNLTLNIGSEGIQPVDGK